VQIEYAMQSSVQEQDEHDDAVPAAQSWAVWPHCVNIVLGGWLVASALTFGHEVLPSGVARVSLERDLAPLAFRSLLAM
jgi:hypothetical protein